MGRAADPGRHGLFLHSSTAAKTLAYYPGPAGATESLLDLDAWAAIRVSNPALDSMEPDVEALLVNRVKVGDSRRREYFLAPIDECYRLVGLIRANWRGLSGGHEVGPAIEGFFSQLRARGVTAPATPMGAR